MTQVMHEVEWRILGRQDIDTALAGLDPSLRMLYTQHALEGLSYRDLAELHELPMITVAARVVRAKAWVRDALRAEGRRYCAIESTSTSAMELHQKIT